MSFSFFDSQPIQYRRYRLTPLDDGPPDIFDDVPQAASPRRPSTQREPRSLVDDALPEMASNDQLLGLEEHGILRHNTLRAKSHEELLGFRPARPARRSRARAGSGRKSRSRAAR